ncbi:MAG TPA: site-specific integrase [Pyrinomonadaceae bacterium]|jgi:integrase|nr:site-specific integrase [Pyrinomonadaceae bacterium]
MQSNGNKPSGKAPKGARKGQIIKKGKGKYLIRVYLGRTKDEDGKEHKRYYSETIEGTASDAEKALIQHLEMRRTGKLTNNPSRQLLGEFLREYYFEISTARRRSNEVDWRKIETHVLPEMGHIKLRELSLIHFQSLYKRLRSKVSAKTGERLSPTTQNHVHRVLVRAINYAHKTKLILQNPMEAVEAPKPKPKEFNVFSREAAKLFLEACDRNKDSRLNRTHFLKNIVGPIFHLALETGMRPEEYMALKRQDITFDVGERKAALLRVRRVLVRFSNTSEWEFDDPKTESSKRTIPLSPTLAARLKLHLEDVEGRKGRAKGWREYDLIFPNNSGEPIHEDTLRRLFKQNVKLAGLDPKKYRLYDLRHSCATLLLLKREHPKVCQERLGHSSVAITIDLYSHFIPSMQEDATKSLSELLYGDSDTPPTHQATANAAGQG